MPPTLRRCCGALGTLVALALVGACAGDPEVQEPPEGRASQWSTYFYPKASSPQVLLLVVDDINTAAGVAVRSAVAEEFVGLLNRWREDECVGEWDPAHYLPQDLELVVIPVSNPALALHGGNTPALHLVTPNALSAENQGWEQAARRAVLSLGTEEPSANAALDALSYWLSLLARKGEPADEAQLTWLRSLPPAPNVIALLALTRDDESSGPAPSDVGLSLPRTTNSIVWTSAECSGAARYDDNELPRLRGFAGVMNPCDGLFSFPYACNSGRMCHQTLPLQLPDGQVACRMTGYLQSDADCSDVPGWLDPLNASGVREPQWGPGVDPDDETTLRQCELPQLEGDSLTSCQTDLDCADCTPGWCFREVFSEVNADYLARACQARGAWSAERLRFVNGVDSYPNQATKIVCDLEPTR